MDLICCPSDVLANVGILQRRPHADNAYLEAQSVGKSGELCYWDSAFGNYYQNCKACILAIAPNAEEVTRSYLDPQFKQFLDFCTTNTPITILPSLSTVVDSASLASKWSSIAKAASTEGYYILPIDYFTLSVETTFLATTLSDGRVTTMPRTRTYTNLNTKAWNLTNPATTTTLASTSGTATPTSPTEAEVAGGAWIAGPVVGAVVAVSSLALVGYFVFRIRRSRRAAPMPLEDEGGQEGDPLGKAQLHSDSIPRLPPAEMDGGVKNAYSEMVANEAPAVELPAESLRE